MINVSSHFTAPCRITLKSIFYYKSQKCFEIRPFKLNYNFSFLFKKKSTKIQIKYLQHTKNSFEHYQIFSKIRFPFQREFYKIYIRLFIEQTYRKSCPWLFQTCSIIKQCTIERSVQFSQIFCASSGELEKKTNFGWFSIFK